MSSGVMGTIAEHAGAPPGYGEIDFRTGQRVEPTVHELAFSDEADRLEQERLERMRRAWCYYDGQQKKPLDPTDDGFDDNVLINKALTVVDKGVAFLFGKPFRLFDGSDMADDTGAASGSADAAPAADDAGDPPAPGEMAESPVTLAIEQIMQANRGMQTWQDAALNGGVCGHAWLKIQPRKGKPPRIVVIDPQTMRVVTHDDDIEKVIEYVQTWSGISAQTGKAFTRRQRTIDQNPAIDETGPFVIVDERSDGDGPFVQTGTVEWPYEWPPIIGCKNLPAPNEFYGKSDIPDDVLDLNDAVNYAESNTQRVFRLHGHPHLWATNMGDQAVDLAPDNIVGLPEGATVGQLEMSGDQHGAQQFADRLGQYIHEQTRVPMIATGRMDKIGVLAALALKVLYAPLVEKTEQKQGPYGWLVTETVKRCLELMRLGKADSFDLELEWPELVPTDAKEEREVAILDNELGVSKATLIEKLGYDADSEAAKRADEASAGVDAAQRAFNEGAGGAGPYDGPPAPGAQPTPPTPPGGAA